MAQVVECLPGKHKALNSNPSTAKPFGKRKKKSANKLSLLPVLL
jgi:hypothetical protein